MSAQLQILTAVKAIIDAELIDGLTVKMRKDIIIREDDVIPIIIVAPGRPSIESEHTENTIVWMRPVFIGIADTPGDGLLENSNNDTGMEELLTLEDQIRMALHKPLLDGADTVFDVDVSPDSLFIPAGVQTGYDMTIFRLDFLSTEMRSH